MPFIEVMLPFKALIYLLKTALKKQMLYIRLSDNFSNASPLGVKTLTIVLSTIYRKMHVKWLATNFFS